jgi:hypothetical protein
LPEFKHKYEEDSARVDRLGIYTCHDDHPLGRFVVGNGHTLRDNPKAQGLDIREELIKFYKQTYSANLMKLAIYGKGMCLLVLERNDVVTPLRRAVGHVDQMGGGEMFSPVEDKARELKRFPGDILTAAELMACAPAGYSCGI